ncbi:hypothetical protein H4R99_003193 [Coemansia sp. RSA 1722]|nr:hypothetical protein IWW45_005711 [Coemansia sp. RSA 485]KAJ2600859.1 hypothetical protein H4R99_003193 [Coemansia sp. RSA 1722]KAJ2601088.1 hypothetical protein GGF39_001452 [Coemansia sp. RSA 1721]
MSTEKVFKAVMVGGTGVGKTSLRSCFLRNSHSWKHTATTNPDFVSTYVTLDNEDLVAMQIWDTGGSATDLSTTNSLCEDADGVLLVFSADNKDSLMDLEKHLKAINYIGKKRSRDSTQMPLVLVQTKADSPQPTEQEVSWCTQAKEMCQSVLDSRSSQEIVCVETSARTGRNVSQAFRTMATLCHAQWAAHNAPLSESTSPLTLAKREKMRTSRHGDPIAAYSRLELDQDSGFNARNRFGIRIFSLRRKLGLFMRRLVCVA